MNFSGMRLSVRLGIAFAVILVLMTVVGGYAINRMQVFDEKIGLMIEDKWPKTVMLNEAKSQANVIARAMRNMILNEDPVEVQKEKKRIEEARAAIGKLFEELKKIVSSENGKKLFATVVENRAQYVESQKMVIGLIESGNKAQASKELMTSVRKTQTAYFTAIDKMLEHQQKELEHVGKESDDLIRQSRLVVIGLLIAAVVLSALLAVIIVRSITVPVQELIAANDRLADKDLTVSITLTGSDELGRLAESSRKMVESLRGILGQVSDSSTQIAAASSQLQSTAVQIATGAEEVASQTGSVATASEEMAATSGDIAQNCVLAAETSRQSSDSANEGGAVVQETIAGMARIAERVKDSARTVESLGERSEQIGDIIETIQDIADQTNLLALNAAIEAARAGEQGRGFAVVADEVRALAERTTKATKEIGAMIKAIQDETKAAVSAMEEGVAEVEKGTEFSQRSGEALQTILKQIGEVSTQINQIATAAEEQTATTGEITTNVQQVTEVVQQTASGAAETAAAASQLASNAKVLEGLVRQFRL
ncbi:methyl-accepting chemotaxis sensory transducer, class 40H [Citrifermentans bemidjiense Bem]|uniref:Methyl-accepting chemotaxis sensory transducer, class 40H n=1 Tax=Citrifermentans bemidjiense (strain ATCC BAA-1014 / DSM 16622 / JCM 12645 / Bem) TaxID=404380 RepID=B5EES5_CITBB|nr:methyl-accepting chemotaxis protein [Citrifermentans bemidjiense]ACH37821.1 methyl-accepting chemotaxis sensory transducer, class 40H [Citrifermentans bemidjiense Bem]